MRKTEIFVGLRSSRREKRRHKFCEPLVCFVVVLFRFHQKEGLSSPDKIPYHTDNQKEKAPCPLLNGQTSSLLWTWTFRLWATTPVATSRNDHWRRRTPKGFAAAPRSPKIVHAALAVVHPPDLVGLVAADPVLTSWNVSKRRLLVDGTILKYRPVTMCHPFWNEETPKLLHLAWSASWRVQLLCYPVPIINRDKQQQP